MNDKIYIHEFIDIIGQNRARYMHHMAANWSPMAQEDRHQLLYGLWGIVGSTGLWPKTVNIWEEDGFEGIARSFKGETSHPDLQDPKLAKWWAKAAEYRSGGVDRLVKPAPWMLTIEEACAKGIRGDVFAHEMINVPPGTAAEHLDLVRDKIAPARAEFGWILAGAWRTVMRADDECIFVWAIPTWDQWAEMENSSASVEPGTHTDYKELPNVSNLSRIIMVDSALCPFKLGRQPSRADREGDWEENV